MVPSTIDPPLPLFDWTVGISNKRNVKIALSYGDKSFQFSCIQKEAEDFANDILLILKAVKGVEDG